MLNVSLERIGRNLTHIDASGNLRTNGHGLRGHLVRGRAVDGCPTEARHDQRVNVSEWTIAVELRSFCTDVYDAGEYTRSQEYT